MNDLPESMAEFGRTLTDAERDAFAAGLPVVDPTTGLVDPDEVIRLYKSEVHKLNRQIDELATDLTLTRGQRDAVIFARNSWHDRWQSVVAERDGLQRLIDNSESLAEVELAAMAEKLRAAEAERDEARAYADRAGRSAADNVEKLHDVITERNQLRATVANLRAAYERLVTAARAWREDETLYRTRADLRDAVDAPEAPVEAPTDALQPRTDEMP